MYRKTVWNYVFVLTLLDISLNTKLSAQGKSHGVSVQDSLAEGITFQEWGKDTGGSQSGASAVSLSPSALSFGRASLAQAHALTVTLTNTANTTMHLASVAGTTPDFHASFFEAKTLPPQGNTTFSVVYLGRREGPVTAHLYIHTSLGVHKYPVSAEGVASEWGLWPLVGLRVPLNATVEPLLTLYNPTDQTIQVSEVYSSGAWLGLSLPGGGASGARGAWAVPPRAERPIVRLRVRPHLLHDHRTLTAYVRIKASVPGGALVVCVEAGGAAAGAHVLPLHLRLRTRGNRDPPLTVDISVGNSGSSPLQLWARARPPHCAAAPPDAHAHPAHPAHSAANGLADNGITNGNGAGAGSSGSGVQVSLVRDRLDAYQPPVPAATLSFDFGAMWSVSGGGGGGGGAAGEGLWCAGWAVVGGAALPYDLRLLPGTLALTPPHLHFVRGAEEDLYSEREVRVRNEFSVPLHIHGVDYPTEVEQLFEVWSAGGVSLSGGAERVAARVRLRSAAPPGATLSAALRLRTNISDYRLPIHLYDGRLHIEWEWPTGAGGGVSLGALGASSTRRVSLRLRNAAPLALCVSRLHTDLPGASLALLAPDARCVRPGAGAAARLTVVAPARAATLRGAVLVVAAADGAAPAASHGSVELTALPGRLAASPLPRLPAAPWVWAEAEIVVESSMEPTMNLESVELPPDDPSLIFQASLEPVEISSGRHTVGTLVVAPERACQPRCYTGLDITTTEGAAWVSRGAAWDVAGARADLRLWAERRDTWREQAHAHRNVSLLLHTSHVRGVLVSGSTTARWPTLSARGAAPAPLCAVHESAALRVRVRNPSRNHALLLQPALPPPHYTQEDEDMEVETPVSELCKSQECMWAADAFQLAEWVAVRGNVTVWPASATDTPAARTLPLLLLPPDAEVEIKLLFTPDEPQALYSYLYLRNNLTITERVHVSGEGAVGRFELGGVPAGGTLSLEVESCGEGGTVRRGVVARNTGRVRLVLRDWAVAGRPCAARGFRVAPCAPLALAPNESRALHLAFTPDYTLARVSAALAMRAGAARATLTLAAAVRAPALQRCAAAAPRPPFEPALRAGAALVAVVALVLALAAAALDAERELRRARRARPPSAPRRPLDLRALPGGSAPAPRRAPPPAPRRRKPRAERSAPDPDAERRAFERWRAGVLRAAPADAAPAQDSLADADRPHAQPEPSEESCTADGYEADPETEEPPSPVGEEDAGSVGSATASASSSSSSSSSPSPDDPEEEADDADDEPDRDPPADREAERASRGPARRSPPGAPAGPRAPRAAGEARRARAGAGERATRAARRGARRHTSPGASPAPAPRVRWGASWSSVVRAAAPPPIAPPAPPPRPRRPPAPPPADNSLFYYNGETHARPPPDVAWRAADALPDDDYLGGVGVGARDAFGASSVWGGWGWGALEVRPPPGFTARPYDPFRSLASIWAPPAPPGPHPHVDLDWRDPPPAHPATRTSHCPRAAHIPDDKRDPDTQ